MLVESSQQHEVQKALRMFTFSRFIKLTDVVRDLLKFNEWHITKNLAASCYGGGHQIGNVRTTMALNVSRLPIDLALQTPCLEKMLNWKKRKI